MQGSVLAIDRALTPVHGQLIVAELDGELALRRLLLNPVAALQAPDAIEGACAVLDDLIQQIYQPESAVPGIVATLSKAYAPPERQGEGKTTN